MSKNCFFISLSMSLIGPGPNYIKLLPCKLTSLELQIEVVRETVSMPSNLRSNDLVVILLNNMVLCNVQRKNEILKCEYCDYTSTHSGNLKAHSRKHSDEILKCEHCDYTTTRSNVLKAHSCKHNGEMLQFTFSENLLVTCFSVNIVDLQRLFLVS